MAKKTVKKKVAKKLAAKKPVLKKTAPSAASKKPMVTQRADFGAAVMDYYQGLASPQRETALAAHRELMNAAPQLNHTVKWGVAQYLFPGGKMSDAEGFTVYATSKSVNLAIGRGGDLADKHPLLEGTGKSMRHVKLRTVADAKSPAVVAILKDAVAMVKDGG